MTACQPSLNETHISNLRSLWLYFNATQTSQSESLRLCCDAPQTHKVVGIRTWLAGRTPCHQAEARRRCPADPLCAGRCCRLRRGRPRWSQCRWP